MNSRQLLLTAALLVLFGTGAFAASATDTIHRDEMGTTRLQVLYPESKTEIDEDRPMISADATRLETPMDPQTVSITLNGVDVTELSEITPAYVIYQPEEPLAPGKYDVRITAKDISRNAIEPLSWTFRVTGAAKKIETAPVKAGQTPRKEDNTTGKLGLSTDMSNVGFMNSRGGPDVNQILREKKGQKTNVDFNFTSALPTHTLMGAYHRETQSYTGIVQDKARFNYYDAKLSAVLGHAWMQFSDLTVLGTELDGLRVDAKTGRWNLTGFSGRTQDPSVSGVYRQMTHGARGTFEWRPGSSTTLTTLTSGESGKDRLGGNAPARIRLTTLRQDLAVGERFTTSFETGWNSYSERHGMSDHDRAYKLLANGRTGSVSAEAEMYHYGKSYYPISEGSSKFLRNDRQGTRVKATWKPRNIATFGAEGEDYYTISQPSYTTKRWNAFVAVSRGKIQSLTWRRGRLGSNGSISETNAVNTVIVIPGTKYFTDTRVTAGWQKVDYNTATGTINLSSGTTIRMLGLSGSFKDILGFSVNYTYSDSGNVDNTTGLGTKNRSKDITAAANWNIIPFKLMWNGLYERRVNAGSNTSNFQRIWKTSLKYVFNKTYSADLGFEHVRNMDDISPIYNYRQNVVRTGVEWRF